MYREEQQTRWWKLVAAFLLCAVLAFLGWQFVQRGDAPHQSDAALQRSPQDLFAEKVEFARNIADFASARAWENTLRANHDGLAEMNEFQSKYAGYAPITGSGVRQMHEERNAILQRQADRLAAGKRLLDATTPVLEQAAKAQATAGNGSLVSSEGLDKAINSAMAEFRHSSLVSKEERLEYEARLKRINANS